MDTNRSLATNGLEPSVKSDHSATDQRSHLLTSWKEIAIFLGKGVRTAQRWERELQLPVRRPGNGKHIVWAVTSELEDWISQPRPSVVSCTSCDCKELLDRANAEIEILQKENENLRRRVEAMSSEPESTARAELVSFAKRRAAAG